MRYFSAWSIGSGLPVPLFWLFCYSPSALRRECEKAIDKSKGAIVSAHEDCGGELHYRYVVVSSGTLPDFESKVSDLLTESWEAVGGVSVVCINAKVRHYLYSQGMRKGTVVAFPHVHKYDCNTVDEAGRAGTICACGDFKPY